MDSKTPINPARLEGLKTNLVQSEYKTSPQYKEIATKEIPGVREEIEKIMKENDLDAIVFPTLSCPASPRFDTNDPTYVCSAKDTYAAGYVASATGFPEVTLPAGATKDSMPVGISFFGLAYSEQKLLDLAYSFEQATKARFAPTVTPDLK